VLVLGERVAQARRWKRRINELLSLVLLLLGVIHVTLLLASIQGSLLQTLLHLLV
jgi:hypothetical protein